MNKKVDFLYSIGEVSSIARRFYKEIGYERY